MIISHKYKFIFIKTKKVAGTSMEVALSKFLSDEDIVTAGGSWKKQKKLGFKFSQNHRKSLHEIKLNEILPAIYHRRFPKKYYQHISASKVRNLVGKEVWGSYFKFTAVRNPFDRVVSEYFWKKPKLHEGCSFREFILDKPKVIRENWNIYTHKNEVLVDDFIKYETLNEDLDRIGDLIGLPESLSGVMKNFNEKGKIRPKDSGYRTIIGDYERKLIEMLDREEIDLFNYEF